MQVRWLRDGQLLCPLYDKTGSIRYYNTKRVSPFITEICIEHTEKNLCFTFYPYKDALKLKKTCEVIFTKEEIDECISPNDLFLKITINSLSVGRKLIQLCHYINNHCQEPEFSIELITDFNNLIDHEFSREVKSVHSRTLSVEKFAKHVTPTYINPDCESSLNYNFLLTESPQTSHIEQTINRLKNGCDPNKRDINGMMLLYALISKYLVTEDKHTLIRIIHIIIFYGGDLYDPDNGKYSYCSAAGQAKRLGLELDVDPKIKIEKPIKVVYLKQRLYKNIITTYIEFDNKKSITTQLMTMNELNKNSSYRSAAFELFKKMYHGIESEINKEFLDSFPMEDDDSTLVELILSEEKIVGFSLFNIHDRLLEIDQTYIKPGMQIGGMMRYLLLSVPFSIKAIEYVYCYAASFGGFNVFRKQFSWPMYNIKDGEKLAQFIMDQSGDKVEFVHNAILGVQRVEADMKIAGIPQYNSIEKYCFHRYFLGFEENEKSMLVPPKTPLSALIITPLTDRLMYNLVKDAKEMDFDFIKFCENRAKVLPVINGKLKPFSNYKKYISTLPPCRFALFSSHLEA